MKKTKIILFIILKFIILLKWINNSSYLLSHKFSTFVPSPPSSASSFISDVHKVRLSLINYIIVVASLYWSSSICSISAIASSKAYLAKLHALVGSFKTS